MGLVLSLGFRLYLWTLFYKKNTQNTLPKYRSLSLEKWRLQHQISDFISQRLCDLTKLGINFVFGHWRLASAPRIITPFKLPIAAFWDIPSVISWHTPRTALFSRVIEEAKAYCEKEVLACSIFHLQHLDLHDRVKFGLIYYDGLLSDIILIILLSIILKYD